MSFDTKRYSVQHKSLLRDTRPLAVRIGDFLRETSISAAVFVSFAIFIWFPVLMPWADLVILAGGLFFLWLRAHARKEHLPFKMPKTHQGKDPNNNAPGQGEKPAGILYLGNDKKSREEMWFTNEDLRTHLLYLGTTGSGKTTGLMSLASNALSWGSGFVYIDGKADTGLWSNLSAIARRFGRDDDIFVINYMTGNSDVKAPSNTLNPFSTGSASYLTQLLVSLLPDASGDNVMWKERAVSMVSAIMPTMTWKRDNQDMPLNVSTIRNNMILNNIIKLSRDDQVPEELRNAIVGYLDTLPGFVHAAFDDNGQVKPPGPDTPNVDTSTSFTQHGYLSMQLTRALQSLGDDYGYIFDSPAADVEMLDVVLNRRILVVLIPALEKSADETANLGKIVAANIKGMMGATLGSSVEGESKTVIENKPTNSNTPFMTIFDEVGYYTAQGMAVMAAQARSLGFSLVFAAQDLPAMEKRVKEEARSIVANCNIKIFGKLEDPSQTKDLFDKTVSSSFVTEVTSFSTQLDSMTKSYYDNASASIQTRSHASYDELRSFKDGEAVVCFSDTTVVSKIYYSKPGLAKAMRVTRFMPLPPPSETLLRHIGPTMRLRDMMVKKDWSAMRADVLPPVPNELKGAINGYLTSQQSGISGTQNGMMAVAGAYVSVHGWPEPRVLPDAAPAPVAAAPEEASGNTGDTHATPSEEDNGDTSSGSGGMAPALSPAAAPKTPAASPFAQGKSPFSSFVKNDDTDASPPVTTHQDMPETSVSAQSALSSSPVSDAQGTPPDTEKTPITLSAQTIDTIADAAEEAHDTLVRSHV